jgi:hypothetical protein
LNIKLYKYRLYFYLITIYYLEQDIVEPPLTILLFLAKIQAEKPKRNQKRVSGFLLFFLETLETWKQNFWRYNTYAASTVSKTAIFCFHKYCFGNKKFFVKYLSY